MKHQFLSSVLTAFFLILAPRVFSQDLDLIVTVKGDSIACRIDSISETHLYYEMIIRNNWAQTQIGLTDVSEYKRSAIDKKQYVFKAGTSIIASQKVIKPIKPVKPVKNAVKTDLFAWPLKVVVLKYERIFSEDISVQLGFYYSWDFPTYDVADFETAFAITPEFRYYPLKKKPAPRGIYLAPNFRYRWSEGGNLDENSGATEINIKYSPAINLGFQMVLKDLFLIDAWGGLGYQIRIGDGNDFELRMGVAIGLVF
jgi:hypothetical protein